MSQSQAKTLRKILLLNILLSFFIISLDSHSFDFPVPIIPADPLLLQSNMIN